MSLTHIPNVPRLQLYGLYHCSVVGASPFACFNIEYKYTINILTNGVIEEIQCIQIKQHYLRSPGVYSQ